MRLVALGLVPLVLAGCGAKYKPARPVLGDFERSMANPVHKPHDNLTYQGLSAGSETPVIPVLAFGAAMDLDVAVMSSDDDLDMIEFARMNVPFGNGYVWMALETKVDSGAQTLITKLDPEELAGFMPELPIARVADPKMEIEDRTTESTVDVHLAYDGPSGRVDATLTGDAPLKAAKKRNGRTFDHSQNELLAALDISASESLFRAQVSVDGKSLGQKRIAGLVPGRFSLVQAQGGLASGSFKIVPTGDAFGSRALGEVVVARAGEAPAVKPPPDMLLKAHVATNFLPIQECWRTHVAAMAEAKEPASPGGVLGFEWAVESGVVKDVKVKAIEGSTFKDDKLSACVTDLISKWTLDSSVNGTAWWSYTFKPADTALEDGALASVALGEGGSTLTAPAPAPEAPPAGNSGTRPDELTDPGAPAEPMPISEPKFKSFATVHPLPDGGSVTMNWLVTLQGDRVTASTTDELRSLVYHYRLVSGAYLELVAITVEQYGRATPVTAVTFTPPLPDLRWQFQGKRTSSFVIDVNGQQSHAVGEVTASWSESGPRLAVNPTEPSWAADRPLISEVVYNRNDGTTQVSVTRGGK